MFSSSTFAPTWVTTLAATLLWIASAAAAQAPTHPAPPTAPLHLEIRDPGRTGLPPGRYRVELAATRRGAAATEPSPQVPVILHPAAGLVPPRSPGSRSSHPGVSQFLFADGTVHLVGRLSGCSPPPSFELAGASARVVSRPDGSLRIELTSRSDRRCRLVATVPAVPGIEGSPIGTAGAPAVPGIEGTDVSTGAPSSAPPLAVRRADEADRRIAATVAKARDSLARLRCLPARGSAAEKGACAVREDLRMVARAPSPAAAVAPLRHFQSQLAALRTAVRGEPSLRPGATRCAAVRTRCTSTDASPADCDIDDAVCLDGLVFPSP